MKSIASLGGLLLVGASVAALAPLADAQVVEYKIDNYTTTHPDTAGTVPATVVANVSALDLSRSGIVDITDASDYGYYAWDWDTTLNTSKYFTFTVTPDSGYEVAPTSLKFTWISGAAGPSTVVVRYSGDSFGSDLVSQAVTLGSDSTFSIDLSSKANFTGATEFRIYAYGGTAGTGDTTGGGFDSVHWDASGQNVTLNGTVVPEPHEYALAAGLGLLAFGVYRRCNRSQKTA